MGSNVLTATVVDTTSLTKSNSHQTSHVYSVSWNIQRSVTSTIIKNIEDESSVIKMYPNPVKDNLQIALKIEKNKEVKIQIFNFNNEVIQNINIDKEENSLYTVSFKGLPSGIYYIRLIIGNSIYTRKIVKID